MGHVVTSSLNLFKPIDPSSCSRYYDYLCTHARKNIKLFIWIIWLNETRHIYNNCSVSIIRNTFISKNAKGIIISANIDNEVETYIEAQGRYCQSSCKYSIKSCGHTSYVVWDNEIQMNWGELNILYVTQDADIRVKRQMNNKKG